VIARIALAAVLIALAPRTFADTQPVFPPPFEQVKRNYVPSEAWLLDRNGEPLHVLRMDAAVRRLPWVRLEELSPALIDALLASEDKRFYAHAGVDWQAALSAMWDNLKRSAERARPRGASTISMQVAAMLTADAKARDGARTMGEKWDQAMAARELEKKWSKREILEAYVNLTFWRGELQGIHAAAKGMFRKSPSGLDRDESVILAALLRGPNAKPGVVLRRACALRHAQSADASCAHVQELGIARLRMRYRLPPEQTLAPHVARRLLSHGGEELTTTLDARVQRFARDTLRAQLTELAGRNVEDGALIVLDNATGDVLAWIGSSAGLSRAEQVDGVLAERQAGSSLKPFLYGLALEKRYITAASLLDDSPIVLPAGGGVFVPQDYERDYKGLVSARAALASSLNIPAVSTLSMVGIEPFQRRLQALGFTTLTESAGFYGYALALGSAEVRLVELANAYRALANGGRVSSIRLQPGEQRGAAKQAMNAQAAWIVGDMLSDRSARALTFGLENSLATRVWSAVKTGTSKDMRDNWCVGFTDRYTVGVWVGNFSGEPMYDVSGVTGAAPIWRDVIHFLHAHEPSRQPRAPRELVSREIRFEPAIEAPRQEWFLAGTEIEVVTATPVASDAALGKIAYPLDGNFMAVDPDIPLERQRVVFLARGAAAAFEWQLDGTMLDGRGVRVPWQPSQGRHVLTLRTPEGTDLDRVSFEVR
jgi:penicillin-binding protein 1C